MSTLRTGAVLVWDARWLLTFIATLVTAAIWPDTVTGVLYAAWMLRWVIVAVAFLALGGLYADALAQRDEALRRAARLTGQLAASRRATSCHHHTTRRTR